MRVSFTMTARDTFLDLLVELMAQSQEAAQSFRIRVERTLSRLVEEPDDGSEVPEHRSLEYLGTPYHFYYRVRDETLWVLAVWDGGE